MWLAKECLFRGGGWWDGCVKSEAVLGRLMCNLEKGDQGRNEGEEEQNLE